MSLLIANKNVGTAVDHVTRAAAVLILVFLAVRAQVIDVHRLAALDGLPGIGAATTGMNARVGDAQSGLLVHENVRRGLRGRADTFVRAIDLVVIVLGHVGTVAQSGLRAHLQEA